MFSVRRIIGDDWADTTRSKWVRERASLEIDYTAYGLPDAIVGLLTDPWVDLTYDGVSTFADYQAFLNLFSAQDPKADRNADTVFNFYDVQFYLADQSAASADLTPTGRLNEEENPFGLDGYRYDAITGLYHVRHRVLDPEQGKWMQRDPAGFVDGGNVCAFAMNSPLSSADPLGLWKVVRSHGATATAITEDKDTKPVGHGNDYDNIFYLAYHLGLNYREFRQWISSHPDPLQVIGRGGVSWDDVTALDLLCPNQKFAIPNTIFYFRATTGPREIHAADMYEIGYNVVDISKRTPASILAGWQTAANKGELFGMYLDVHSDGSSWWENNVSKKHPIYFGSMQNLLTYKLSVAYMAACHVGDCPQGSDLVYVEPEPKLLLSRVYRDYFPEDVIGTFIPVRHDQEDRIRSKWRDPEAIK